MRRRLTAIAVALALWPAAVSAAPGDGSDVGSGGDDGTITAGATYTREGVRRGRSECTWQLANSGAVVDSIGSITWPRVVDSITYNLWLRTCPDGQNFVEVADVDSVDLLPALLRDMQSRALPRPTPVFEGLDPEFGWAYVRTPLDFRVAESVWREVSVTASAGPVWATVTARPSRLIFESGDPAANEPSAACAGSAPLAVYEAETPGECSYTFVNASSTSPHDGYHFLTTVSVEWEISWVGSGGATGVLDPYTTSGTAELAVAEVKGLVTCTGPRASQGGC